MEKTPIQELMDKHLHSKKGEVVRVVLHQSDLDELIEREKQVIEMAWNSAYGGDASHSGEDYYKSTFNFTENKTKEEYGTPLSVDELVGHYKTNFLKPEEFRDLLESFIKNQ